jgi:hypothetical protein
MKWILPTLLFLLALTVFWAIGCYHRLQALRAAALQSLAQHAAALNARNGIVAAICEALSSNLQHERAAFSAVQTALHRNAALCEAATLARGSHDAMTALAQSEQELAAQMKNLKEINATYPELAVNAQLSADWLTLDGALARCRFSGEQYKLHAQTLNAALGEAQSLWLARVMKLRTLQSLPSSENVDVMSTQQKLL